MLKKQVSNSTVTILSRSLTKKTQYEVPEIEMEVAEDYCGDIE